MMSDTPRTDEKSFSAGHCQITQQIVDADFARTLERELASVAATCECGGHYPQLEAMFKELQQQLTAELEAREKAEKRTKELEAAIIEPVDIECFRKLGEYLGNALEEDKFNAVEPMLNSCLMVYQNVEQRAESAEQKLREAREQEPVAYIYPAAYSSRVSLSKHNKPLDWDSYDGDREWYETPLYAAPIPPADVAKLRQADNSELKESFDAIKNILHDTQRQVAMLYAVLPKVREELRACQAAIHLSGDFDPLYVQGAQAAMKLADNALKDTQATAEAYDREHAAKVLEEAAEFFKPLSCLVSYNGMTDSVYNILKLQAIDLRTSAKGKEGETK